MDDRQETTIYILLLLSIALTLVIAFMVWQLIDVVTRLDMLVPVRLPALRI